MTKCIFCNIIRGNSPATIIDEDEQIITILDKKPLFPGHCLIIPKIHIETLPELNDKLIHPFFRQVQKISTALPEALKCQGTFVAMNNIVSQSVPNLHVHVVPRTKGDGLKGFFWPRNNYKDKGHKKLVADKIREKLGVADV